MLGRRSTRIRDRAHTTSPLVAFAIRTSMRGRRITMKQFGFRHKILLLAVALVVATQLDRRCFPC